MLSTSINNKIMVSFAWQGPNTVTVGEESLKVGVVNLLFKDAQTKISVNISEYVLSVKPERLVYECRRGDKVTYPEALNVTIEQIENLTIQIGFITGSQMNASVYEVKLETPREFEVGKKYCLIVSSHDQCPKAILIEDVEDKFRPVFDNLARYKADLKELYVNLSDMELQTLNCINEALERHKNNLRKLEEAPSEIAGFEGSIFANLTNVLKADIEKLEKQKAVQMKLMEDKEKLAKDLLYSQ